MVGLGETDEEILEVMRDLRAHDVDMLTVGQYLQPSPHHLTRRALRAPGHLRDVRARGRRPSASRHAAVRPDGALLVPRRSAGARRGRGQEEA